MTLREYLDKHRIKQKDMAARLEVSEPFLTRLLAGTRKPSLQTLAAIDRETKGKVTVRDFDTEAA